MVISTRALRSRDQPVTVGKVLEEEMSTPRSLVRDCPSPAPSVASSTSSFRRSKSRSIRSSHSFSNMSFSSPMSKSSSSIGKDDSDDSDDEKTSTRLGGCRQSINPSKSVDDSNKENVAPHRHLTRAALELEQLTQQEESVAQRTRARGTAPMSERSMSHSGALGSGSSSSGSTISSLRPVRRTVSSPSTRKRIRAAVDPSDDDDDDIPTASTRVRLDRPASLLKSPTEDSGSYFSSQASIFDNASILESQVSFSRCTTPDLQEVHFGKESSKQEALDSLPTFANIFVHAKSLLRYGTGTGSQVVGRERERCSIQRFLQKRFNLFAHLEHSASPQGETFNLDGAAESGSLYISGLPGTGKTALVRSILSDLEEQGGKTPRIAFVDCMTVQHPRQVFGKILEALGECNGATHNEQDEVEAEHRLSKLVKDRSQRVLVVLDEIDHLLRNRAHQNILYRIFSWGTSSSPVQDDKSGSCALIGIANSLDLTEKFVPLLASKGAAPAVLNFRPFEAAEMMTVIRARLSQLYPRYDVPMTEDFLEEQQESSLPLFEPVALELAAKKIAAATGDLRKTLDACRLAIEALESEAISQQGDLSLLTIVSAPKVRPSHIFKVLSNIVASPQLTKIRVLGLQSKLVLLAVLIAQKRQKDKLDVLGATTNFARVTMGDLTIRQVESTYMAMLKNDDDAGAFPTVESSELMDVIEGLEVEGVLRIVSEMSKERLSSSHGIVGISPSGKRAAKKQLLANNRAVALAMSSDDILRGICTASPTNAVETSSVVIEAINRVWNRESDRVERCKSWENMAEQSKLIRDEELGGGRGAMGI